MARVRRLGLNAFVALGRAGRLHGPAPAAHSGADRARPGLRARGPRRSHGQLVAPVTARSSSQHRPPGKPALLGRDPFERYLLEVEGVDKAEVDTLLEARRRGRAPRFDLAGSLSIDSSSEPGRPWAKHGLDARGKELLARGRNSSTHGQRGLHARLGDRRDVGRRREGGGVACASRSGPRRRHRRAGRGHAGGGGRGAFRAARRRTTSPLPDRRPHPRRVGRGRLRRPAPREAQYNTGARPVRSPTSRTASILDQPKLPVALDDEARDIEEREAGRVPDLTT